MFRALLLAAGVLLALGTLSPADAARSRARAAATEATTTTTEAPRAHTSRRSRSAEARRERRSRGEAVHRRGTRHEAGTSRRHRGGQTAPAGQAPRQQ